MGGHFHMPWGIWKAGEIKVYYASLQCKSGREIEFGGDEANKVWELALFAFILAVFLGRKWDDH